MEWIIGVFNDFFAALLELRWSVGAEKTAIRFVLMRRVDRYAATQDLSGYRTGSGPNTAQKASKTTKNCPSRPPKAAESALHPENRYFSQLMPHCNLFDFCPSVPAAGV